MNGLKGVIFADKLNYQGYVDHRFKDLAEQFSRLQDGRAEQGGAALAVYFQGKKVVDIYTGKTLFLLKAVCLLHEENPEYPSPCLEAVIL